MSNDPFSLGHGLKTCGTVHLNLSVPQLIEHSLQRGEGQLTDTGALTTRTYSRTGRSPGDKFVVKEPSSENAVWWGPVNQPMSEQSFEDLLQKIQNYLSEKVLYVFDGFAGADPKYRHEIRIVTEFAWHNLFVKQLFLRPTPEELDVHTPEFTVICAPGVKADPATEGTKSEAFIALNFAKKLVIIGGTQYAGEMKKSIFTALNYMMPLRGVMPMHCSANIGEDGKTALFFGLSGTGKTTLSADPQRRLIGDDEHGWSDHGIFNFEGGCYAKCIDLSPEKEPQIFSAIRFGAVLENVILDETTRVPDYTKTTYTENTRAAYPIDYIPNAELSEMGGHPETVIFLTADAFGVLPPISKLTPEQAMYHFLSGYTSKLAGTEAGVTEPQTTFSACFGQPFLPLPPSQYAKLLGERLEKHKARCFLINTGWTGGAYGVGKRMNLPITRAMVTAALSGALDNVQYKAHPIFGIWVPTSCPNVPTDVLDPKQTWDDPAAYDQQAYDLAARFQKNFERFPDAAEAVKNAGPKVTANAV